MTPRYKCSGEMHFYGDVVKQDYGKAFELYQLAGARVYTVDWADQVEAQCRVGLMYKTGQFVKKDFKEAARWFTLATEGNPMAHDAERVGNPQAFYELSQLFKRGQGVEQSDQFATELIELAADHNNVDAQFMRGLSFYNKKKYGAALQWLQLSALQHSEMAKRTLERMQQSNQIPVPLPGTAVTLILLSTVQYRGRRGTVVAADGRGTKPGRVSVVLDISVGDGDSPFHKPLSFKLMNVQIV